MPLDRKEWRFLFRTLSTTFLACCLTASIPIHANELGLADAVRKADVDLIESLIAKGADVNKRDGRLTPLAIAAVRGDLGSVKQLLAAGADPNATSLNGANALSMATRSCNATQALLRELINAGADLENRSGVGITPLMFAVQEELTETALMLIDAGADVQTLNPFGEGILSYAIYTENTQLINKAIDLKVDVSQLRYLYTTVDYDPPGMKDSVSHHTLLCSKS